MSNWNIYMWLSKLVSTVVSHWRTTWRKLNLFFQQMSFYLCVSCTFCLTLIPEHGDYDCCSWQPSSSTKLQRHSHPTGQRLGKGKIHHFSFFFLTLNNWVTQPLAVNFTTFNKTLEKVLHNKIHINFPLSILSIPNFKCIIPPLIILVQQQNKTEVIKQEVFHRF